MENQTLKTGTTLQGGKYRIERVLGQGGFGITYLATQELLNRKVAIKEFFMREYCDRCNDNIITNTPAVRIIVERFKKKFISEASTIAKFRHPNIIAIYDMFLENNTAYYVMEYIEGKSLEEVIKLKGAFSEAISIGYICQVGSALECMHQRKVNHLDVKPGNIMLRNNNKEVVLIDFGISKQYDEKGKELTTTLVGISEGYAPIEQYQKGELNEFCSQTDIYGLGATLYKMITGITPPSIFDILSKGITMPENITPNLRNVIIEAMNIEKEKRPSSVAAFLEECQKSLVQNNTAITLYPYSETVLDVCESVKNAKGDILKLLAKNLGWYDDCPYIFKEGFAAVRKHGRWGFVNDEGVEIIPCTYEEANNFSEGLASVKKGGKWGFINSDNFVVIPFVYDHAWSFSNGYAAVEKNEKHDLIDKSGAPFFSLAYDNVHNFSDGLAVVVKKDKNDYNNCGYADRHGDLIIPLIYGSADSFQNGFAVVGIWEKFLFINHGYLREGIVDKNGNIVIPFVYEKVYGFNSDGISLVKNKNQDYGFIDKEGQEFIPCQFVEAKAFNNGMAPVIYNHYWGYIDMGGNLIVSSNYRKADCVENGMAKVMDQNFLYGYINEFGEEAIPCIFQDAYSFKGNLARVNQKGKWGYIDKNGKFVIPCIYDSAMCFSEGLAFVRKKNRLGCVDVTGRSSFDY